MKKISIFLFVCLFTLSSFGVNKSQCQTLLDWMYRDLTIKNFEVSYERAFNKLLLGIMTAHNNSRRSFGVNSDMTEIFQALKRIEPEYKKYISPNLTVWLSSFSSSSTTSELNSFSDVFAKWQTLQSNSPELFNGLDKSYYLDDWDQFTIKNLLNINQMKVSSPELKERLSNLQDNLNLTSTNSLNGRQVNFQNLKTQINTAQKKLVEDLNMGAVQVLDNFSDICTSEEINLLITQGQYACPVLRDEDFSDLNLQLKSIEDMLTKSKLLNEETPKELIPINRIDYEQSTDPRSTYCTRPSEMLRMLVIHHTATEEEMSPTEINQMHLENRTNSGEPWKMVGYNYMVSSSFDGATPRNPKVFQGREDTVKGAHAGGYSAPLSSYETDFYEKLNIQCGNEEVGMKTGSALDQLDSSGGISGNLISLGIAIIGNFSPFKFELIDGVFVPINPDSEPYDSPSNQQIDATARLACDLQKKHKNLKTIVPHSYFKITDCPGSLIKYLNQIKDRATIYGCSFTVKHTKAEGNK